VVSIWHKDILTCRAMLVVARGLCISALDILVEPSGRKWNTSDSGSLTRAVELLLGESSATSGH
ncbi:hypothetical protein Tco_1116619, partial [Tanacetum coccineum]